MRQLPHPGTELLLHVLDARWSRQQGRVLNSARMQARSSTWMETYATERVKNVKQKQRDRVPAPPPLPKFVPRAGLQHLVSLLPHFRLVLYSSAMQKTLTKRISEIEAYLARDPGILVRL